VTRGRGLSERGAGLVGAFPVKRVAGAYDRGSPGRGRTKLVGLTRRDFGPVLSPLGRYVHTIPLAALAGVLVLYRGRLIKIHQLRLIWRSRRLEFSPRHDLNARRHLGGRRAGTRHRGGASRYWTRPGARPGPRWSVLGRRAGTTSWEPLSQKDVESVDHTLVVLFDNDIFFANAGVFRRELHQLMVKYPETKHLVVDAVAISDIDFTGMTILSQVLGDLKQDGVSVVLARANPHVKRSFHSSYDGVLRAVKFHDSVKPR